MTFSASIILPVINETFSLEQTLEIVSSGNDSDIIEYIIVVCNKTTKQSREIIRKLLGKYRDKLLVIEQKLPFLGGAIRDAFDVCKGSHVVMMASDMETDPYLVRELIKLSKQNPGTIITATRWKTKGGFEGYSPVKFVFNWIFQSVFSLLYRTHLSDMTYGYRIFPTQLVQGINWEELRHPFLFETIVKPLRLGTKVIEIPTKWEARKEGESQNPFFRNFEYFRTGIKSLFYSKERILKQNS
jgi:glycosyltransferase involved in cell wall biosynthesis